MNNMQVAGRTIDKGASGELFWFLLKRNQSICAIWKRDNREKHSRSFYSLWLVVFRCDGDIFIYFLNSILNIKYGLS
jgi:hypothetical protein